MPDQADTHGTPGDQDVVDVIMERHLREQPELNLTGLAVVGRMVRASQILGQRMRGLMAQHGVEPWEFDVLASLTRSEPPHRLTAGALVNMMMLSPGALTNRVDRLLARGLVTRDVDPDNRRQVLIGLTDDGRQLAERLIGVVAQGHAELVAALSPDDREHLASTLRTLLLSLGDHPAAGQRGAGRRGPREGNLIA